MKLKISFIVFGIFSFLGVTSATCAGRYSFACNDNTCISFARVCDGNPDCPNEEDEFSGRAGCESVRQCMQRNVTAARANGYSCRKPCNSSELTPCSNPRKQCICDDECGYSCLNTESPCFPFPPIDHSQGHEIIRFNGTSKVAVPPEGPFKYGDMIKYVCEEGKSLVGHLQRCNAARKWSLLLPRCIDLKAETVCNYPVPPDSSTFSEQPKLTQFAVGSILTVQCEEGYEMEGNKNITCLSNGTWSEYPRCFEIAVDLCRQNRCNGRGTCQTSMGVETCKCDPGFYAYACEGEYTCFRPNFPDRGYIAEELDLERKKDEWKYGEVANIRCLDGYELEGVETYTCSGKGDWTEGTTKCIRIYCMLDYYLMPEGTVVKGFENFQSLYYHKFNVGDIALVGCRDGMQGEPVSSMSLICTRGGRWTPDYKSMTCHPKAEAVCNYPVLPGSLTLSERPELTQFVMGSILTGQCEEGYEMEGDKNITCLSNGTWSEYPRCFEMAVEAPIVCQYPDLSQAVIFDELPEVVQFSESTVLRLQCEEGYKLIGNKSIACLDDGTWSVGPICEKIPTEIPRPKVVCNYPVLPELSMLSELPESTQFDAGSILTLECREGYYLAGDASIICRDTGTWSQYPECVEKVVEIPPPELVCQQPELSGGVVFDELPEVEQFAEGDKLQLRCQEGYELSGNNNVVCRGDGTWSDGPLCENIPQRPTCSLNQSLLSEGVAISRISELETLENGQSIELYCLKADLQVYNKHLKSFFNTTTCAEGGTWRTALETFQCVRVCRSPPQQEDDITVLSSRGEFFFSE